MAKQDVKSGAEAINEAAKKATEFLRNQGASNETGTDVETKTETDTETLTGTKTETEDTSTKETPPKKFHVKTPNFEGDVTEDELVKNFQTNKYLTEQLQEVAGMKQELGTMHRDLELSRQEYEKAASEHKDSLVAALDERDTRKAERALEDDNMKQLEELRDINPEAYQARKDLLALRNRYETDRQETNSRIATLEGDINTAKTQQVERDRVNTDLDIADVAKEHKVTPEEIYGWLVNPNNTERLSLDEIAVRIAQRHDDDRKEAIKEAKEIEETEKKKKAAGTFIMPVSGVGRGGTPEGVAEVSTIKGMMKKTGEFNKKIADFLKDTRPPS